MVKTGVRLDGESAEEVALCATLQGHADSLAELAVYSDERSRAQYLATADCAADDIHPGDQSETAKCLTIPESLVFV
jgi:hypothetical protein